MVRLYRGLRGGWAPAVHVHAGPAPSRPVRQLVQRGLSRRGALTLSFVREHRARTGEWPGLDAVLQAVGAPNRRCLLNSLRVLLDAGVIRICRCSGDARAECVTLPGG
jgi:hypothetical protein